LCDIPLLYKPMISSFSSNVLFINELHSKSFLSNFWGAVQVQPYSEGGDLIRPFAPALQDGASLAHGI
ncbi:MAG TPA: hypothetical protein K8V47_09355, partial [Candidatus Amulumruptor caecigallinarius]|nr:hypothetical protein [Candidatus Amulumruptor caecigallinarius]